MFRPCFRAFLVAVACTFGFAEAAQGPGIRLRNLQDKLVNPFASSAHARVFLFVRTDCPITNRYAPELQRIASEYGKAPVEFWLVYPDPAEQAQTIQKHVGQYQLPGTALFDPRHQLVAFAHATVAPEAAVFDAQSKLTYHGRIDDRYVSIGKSRPGGPQTHDLEDAIARTLHGKPVPQTETRAVGCSLADIE